MKPLLNGLSGYIPVRNGDSLDYCWREVARSMLPVCDELILCDSDSTDGTREAMEEWAGYEPKIRVINYPWPVMPTYEQVAKSDPGPPGQPRMLITWLNWIRGHCRYDMQICSDADEVLCPKSYDAIREAVAERGCRYFYRLHFWRDAKHITRDGAVVGTHVARLGPTELEMVSDEPRPEGDPLIRQRATKDDRLRFFHYGFLRPAPAFYAKSKVMQPSLLNCYDDRLKRAEETGVSWFDLTEVGSLVEFNEDHPECARGWLAERGYL